MSVIDAASFCCPFREVGQTQTNATGDYSVSVPAGTYKVEFSEFPPAARPHMYQWWPDKRSDQDATPIVVAADRPGIDAALERAVFIRGHVSDAIAPSPIPGTFVAAWDATVGCCRNFTGDITDASGNYAVIAPLGSQVKVGFGPPPGSRYLPQFWNNQPSFEAATMINATADQDHIDAQLHQGFVISGTVTGPGGPASLVQVNATRGGGASCCQGAGQTSTDAAGHYQLAVPAGTYRINVTAPPAFRVVTQWWNGVAGGTAYFDHATDIVLGPGDATGKDFTIVYGSLIEGRVTASVGGAGLSGIGVTANDASGSCCEGLAFGGTDSSGNYSLIVPRGRLVKVFFAPGPGSAYLSQWWNGATSFAVAQVIETSFDRPGINAQLSGATFTLSGRATERGTGIALGGISVRALDASVPCCPQPDAGGTFTDAFGNYALRLPAGSYKLTFFEFPFGSPPHFPAMYHDKRFDYEADVIVLNGDVAGIDQSLLRAVLIGGRVTAADGTGIAGIQVSGQDGILPCCRFIDGAQTDAAGYYRFIAPLGSTIKVEFGVFGGSPPGTHFIGEWWDNQPTFEVATPILVDGDKTLNAELASNVGNVISGRVTDSANPGVGVANVSVSAQPNFGCCFHSTSTGPDGHYSLDLTPGTYRISFNSYGSDFLEQWWNNKSGYSAADLLTVPSTTIDLTSINAVLMHGIPVRGTVTAAVGGATVAQVNVLATLDDPGIPCCVNYQAQTGADGTYTMYVRAGHYRINFQPPSTTEYVSEYWDGQPDFGSATVLNIVGSTEHINATLDRGFRITGRVTDANGSGGVANVYVGISDVICCNQAGYGFTGLDGTYSATVRAGTYTVAFNPPFGSDFVLQYWNNKPTNGAATHLVVDAAKPDIDAVLAHGFRVTGRITDAADPTRPLPGSSINALTPSGDFLAYASADGDGNYSLFLAAGDYILWFDGPVGSGYAFEYWNDKPDQTSADIVHVAGPLSGYDVGLAVPVARQLTAFDMSAAPTDASTGATAITFTVRVTGFASLARGWIFFGSPSGTQPEILVQFDAAARIEGDDHTDTYRFEGVLPGSAEHGTWTITSVNLYEASGPFLYFTTTDLAARGFPTQVTHGN